MLNVRKARDRGHADYGWLNAYHTFSFAGYQDPDHMRFGSLRVMNEDRIAAGRGFDRHGHRNMEIITYVLEGSLEHKDSMGNGSVLLPGKLQRMTAGSGVEHSECNASPTDELHLYQIWIHPDRKGLEPGYEERSFVTADKHNRLCAVASPDAGNGAMRIHQDVAIYIGELSGGHTMSHVLEPKRRAWLQVVRGACDVHGVPLSAGDGLAVTDESQLDITAAAPAEVMLFDLA